MVIGVSSNNLSSIYRQQSNDYTRVLEQIAAGRRFARPSDDFTSFMRMRGAEQSAARFQGVNDRLIEAKEKSIAASSIGNAVYDGLMELRGLADAYAAADTAGKARLEKEFTQKQDALNATITTNNTNTTTVEVNVNPDDVNTSANRLTFTPSTLSELELNITDNASAFNSAFNTAVEEVVSYTAKADAFNSAVDRQLTINQNIVAAKESTASAIGAIDEVQEIGRATALAVRQQATVAMAAQANISQANLARLFQ